MDLVSAVMVVLGALWSSPPATEDERPGPPLKQRASRGTTGPITYEVFEEVYYRSADLPARRHPYAGADYFTRRFYIWDAALGRFRRVQVAD